MSTHGFVRLPMYLMQPCATVRTGGPHGRSRCWSTWVIRPDVVLTRR